AITMFREIGDSDGEANALNGTGECLLGAADPVQSRDCLLAALSITRENGDRHQEVRAHRCLARAYQAAQSAEHAHEHWRTALEICADLDITADRLASHR